MPTKIALQSALATLTDGSTIAVKDCKIQTDGTVSLNLRYADATNNELDSISEDIDASIFYNTEIAGSGEFQTIQLYAARKFMQEKGITAEVANFEIPIP